MKTQKLKTEELKLVRRNDILKAIHKWDNDIDVDDKYRNKRYKSKTYLLHYGGKDYYSKVIFAIAASDRLNRHVDVENLVGGKDFNQVGYLLAALGFEVEGLIQNVEGLDSSYSDEEILEHASSLSVETLSRIAVNQLQVHPSTYISQVQQYRRNHYIAKNAIKQAQGICQLCNKLAPFYKSDGTPYLETHHIIWLSKGGEDSVMNTVALCPNCHRKMHVVNSKEDIEYLLSKNKKVYGSTTNLLQQT